MQSTNLNSHGVNMRTNNAGKFKFFTVTACALAQSIIHFEHRLVFAFQRVLYSLLLTPLLCGEKNVSNL